MTAFPARPFLVLVLGLAGMAAMAQADPPGRVARLNHTVDAVVFSPAGDNEWTDAELNRPLTRGDRLWTDRGSRAEVQVGSSAVRMDGQTHLEILALDDQAAQLSVTQGTIHVRVRSLPEGENFEVDTPNLAYRAAYPGDYRIDVDAASGTTRVTIHSGTGAVFGENGQAQPLGAGQQITFRIRSLAQVNAQESPPQDAFDRWAADRNRLEDQSISARYVPREVVGYQQLDAHGQWAQDATYGMVWYPQSTAVNWAPYRHGRWEWIAPWGWSWIDDAPWGFATSHYGRWALIGTRWAWVPGRLGLHPLYAPALVAFIGSGSSGGIRSVSLVSGRPGVAWFPLAPGEAWQPGYHASPVYISTINRNVAMQDNATYAHQRHAEALTAISTEDFHRGRPVRAALVRLAANSLSTAQVVPPPPMPEHSSVIARERATPSPVVPPAGADIRQVIVKSVPGEAVQRAQREREAARRETAQRDAQVQAQATQAQAAQGQTTQTAQARATQAQTAKAEAAKVPAVSEQTAQAEPPQPRAEATRARPLVEQDKARRQRPQRAEQQATARAQPKVAEAAKPAKPAALAAAAATQPASRTDRTRGTAQARRAAPAKREQVALQAGQARREREASRAEQARREQMARAEQAKREHIAARTDQAKRAQLAQGVEQAKREQAASRAEQARQQAKRQQTRREQLANRAEQSRREAQLRRTQERQEAQARRDEQSRRESHAQRVEQARLIAERDAQVLREQRVQREEQARRESQEREQQAQREALQRQQQALADQQRRDQQLWERQQRARQRPDLREDRRGPPPEVWQRGIPIITPGRTS